MKNKNKEKNFPKNKKFEEFYFKGYYSGIGDFSKKRDKELTNWFRGVVEYIEKIIPIKKGRGRKLLEFGCATGAAANLFADFGYKVFSTDISSYAVKQAKAHYPDIEFSVHDMQKIFHKEKDFDVVIAFDVIEHLEDPEKGIKNIYKILKKGGISIVTTPNKYQHVISNDPTHINVKLPSEWLKIFKKSGFKKIVVKQVTFIPYFYRFHWRLNYALPFPIVSAHFISPVFIIAVK